MEKEFWDDLSLWKRLYSRAMEPVCAAYGLTRMELDVLLFLASNPELDTLTHIVECRQLSKSHVSTSLAHLEAEGYLKRSFRNGNRRTVHLLLLPRAQQVIEEGQQAREKLMQSVFADFSPEEIRQLKALLCRVGNNVRTVQTERSH